MLKKEPRMFIVILLTFWVFFNFVLGVNASNVTDESVALQIKNNQLDGLKEQILRYIKGVNLKEDEIEELNKEIASFEEGILKIISSIEETNENIEMAFDI